MKARTILSVSLSALIVLICGVAIAQDAPETVCVQGDLQRRVAIFYETGVAVPCEVHYFRDTEAPGERQVLWRAMNESGYCESQAASFVQQLEGWGWTCSASAPEEVIDDTQDLAPATDPEVGG